MTLEEQISEKSKEIATDSLSMSVGELVSLYKDQEIDIHPEFQRFFRWSPEQKSKLIESLLLGIPIPPIFVSQTSKGKWDIIDGLQRLSTIFQLLGILQDQNGITVPPLILEETRYLPLLKNKRWSSENIDDELPQTAMLTIKRARIDIKIVLNKSDSSSKYELFQRLNTGGSLATDQEVRNCLLIMVNKDYFDWLQFLSEDENFIKCIPLSDKSLIEQFNIELVIRFLVFRTLAEHELTNIGDLGPYLTDKILKMAEDTNYDKAKEELAFRKTFKLLADSLAEDSFRKYDNLKDRASGIVLISFFEIVALGIGYNCIDDNYNIDSASIKDKQHSIQETMGVSKNTGSGVSASRRIPTTIKFGRNLFKQ